jgi:hypothetical protein
MTKGKQSWKLKNLEYNWRRRIKNHKFGCMKHSRETIQIIINRHHHNSSSSNNIHIALHHLSKMNNLLLMRTINRRKR